jgi:hypothetical protein
MNITLYVFFLIPREHTRIYDIVIPFSILMGIQR